MNLLEPKDKLVLNFEDPRDAFIMMLMERIECLEDRLSRIIEPKLDYLNQERLKFECESSSVSSKTTRTFTIKLYHYSNDIDVIMSLCVNAVNEIIKTFGVKAFVSVSAVIENDGQDFCVIYLNMHRRCWTYETIKALSDVKISCLMKIEKDLASAYNYHIGMGENSQGYVFSAYDLNGNYIEEPKWVKWERMVNIYEP
jgi:hypothetical protein